MPNNVRLGLNLMPLTTPLLRNTGVNMNSFVSLHSPPFDGLKTPEGTAKSELSVYIAPGNHNFQV